MKRTYFDKNTVLRPKLEANGVGRPSTYASILSTIQDRGYAKKEGGKFSPTELGFVVTDLLVKNFDDIFDVKYTARMEGELDDIEEGKIDWRAAMTEFYGKFKVDLVRAESSMEDIKRSEKPTDLICDKCGKPMILRWGKHGWFVACSGYPECTSTREPTPDMIEGEVGAGMEFTEQDETEYCENCGREMVLKKGRFGQFYACSGYPECKTTKPVGGEQKKADVPLDENCPLCNSKLMMRFGRFGEFTSCSSYPTCKYIKQKTIGVKCPNCTDGEVVERRSKRGKTFFGCNKYPECDFVAWGKPISEKCPNCESAYLIEKYLKSGAWAQCPNYKECKFKRELEPETPATAVAAEAVPA